MQDQTISCPSCATKIPLTETLSAQIKNQLQAEFEAENRKKQQELANKVQELENQKKQIEEEKKSIDKVVDEKMQIEKVKLWNVAQQKAKEKLNTELTDLKNTNEEVMKKLRESEQNELDLRKKSRELEEQKRNMELEIQRKLDKERVTIAEGVKKEVAEEGRMKLLEKDKQMEILKKTIEDLKRQSEQGSMQIQGEVQEDDLKQLLQATFPLDQVDDVPQGIRGADLIQTVVPQFGETCGVILWESKNTKSWSNDWIKKLKSDQGIAKADICVLVSKVLPEDIDGFGMKEGVWIVDYKYIVSLVSALRFHLIEMQRVKKSLVGTDEKMEYLYNYLSGSQFKNRIENIVLGFSSLKDDLETERRSMQRIWNKREKEIEKVVLNTAGMYGDLQGIIGASLPTIKSLELPEGEEEEVEEKSESEVLEEKTESEVL